MTPPTTRTLAEVLALPDRTAVLVCALPTRTDARLILSGIADLPESRTSQLLITTEPLHTAPGTARILAPERGRTPEDALSRLRSHLRKQKKIRRLVVDAEADFGAWMSSVPQRRRFHALVLRLTASLEAGLVWIGARNQADPSELAAWKSGASTYLHMFRSGQVLSARFLATPGAADPALFDPFRLLLPGEPPADRTATPEENAPFTPDEAALFRAAPEGILSFRLNGEGRTANSAALSLLGITAEDLGRIGIPDLVAPASLPRVARMLVHLRRRRRAGETITIRKKNGTRLRLAVVATPAGQEFCVAALRDVTAEEREENALRAGARRLEDVVRTAPHPAVVFVNRRAMFWNIQFGAQFPGLTGGDVELTISRLFGRGARSLLSALYALEEHPGSPPVNAEAAVRDGEGEPRWFDVAAVPCMLEGKTAVHCILVPSDERRRVLEALRSSEVQFRAMIEDSPEPAALVREGLLLHANPRLLALIGPAAEVTGRPLEDLFRHVERKERLVRPAGSRQAHAVKTLTAVLARKDGVRVVLEAVEGRVDLPDGPADVLFFRDVTQRADEERTFRSDQRAAQVVRELEAAAGSSLLADDLLRNLFGALMKLLQARSGGVARPVPGGRGLLLPIHEGMGEATVTALTAQTLDEGLFGFLAKTQEPLVLRLAEYPPHLPLKSLFADEGWSTVVFLPLVDGDTLHAVLMAATEKQAPPHVEQALGLMVHALGRRLASAASFTALRESEERYRSAVESIADVIYQTSPTGAFLFLSPNVERLLGYRPDEFYRAPDLWRGIVHPDDRTRAGQRIGQQSLRTEGFHLEYRVLPKGKATYRWVRDAVRYDRGPGGELLSITGIVSDITDRVELEAALVKSEELKTNVLESVQEGVMVLDRSFTVIDWNGAMEAVTGVLRETAMGKPIAAAAPGVLDERILGVLRNALGGESGSTDDLPVPAQGDPERFLWVRCSPLRDNTGAIRGVVGIVTDISARRRLEREVRESEETLRNVIDAMGDALMISDLQGKVWEVNREFTRITGYQRSEVLGLLFPYPWVLDDEMPQFVTWIAALREQNYLRDFDMTWRRRDGGSVDISLNTTMLRNAMGEPVAMLNIARDITDRRRLGRELETRNRQLLALNAIAGSISTSLDLQEVLRVAAAQLRELLGADMILVYLRDQGGSGLQLAYHDGLREGMDEAVASLPTEGSATGAVVNDRRPIYITESLLDDPRVTVQGRAVLQRLGINSLGAIPLQSKDRVLGALDVAFRTPHEFSTQEQQLLLLIGNQIGPAIENAQLYAEVQAQVQRVTVLYELGRRLTGLVDTIAVLNGVHGEAARAVPFGVFTCYRPGPDAGQLVPLLSRGRDGAPLDQEELTTAAGSALHRLAAGEHLLLRDDLLEGVQGRSHLGIPLRRDEHVDAILLFSHPDPGAFSATHLRLVESIGNLTEIALEKARLYEDTVSKSREIEERNKELDDFTYVVSHDLKEPLISIEGYSKILLNDYRDRVDEEGREYLGSVVQSTKRMKSLIDDLLTMSRLGRVTDDLQPVAVGQVLEEILGELRFTLSQRGVEVTVPPGLPEVRYNATQLAMVFRNLITNALKFNDKPAPRIIIGWVREGDHHLFSVADNGIGIEREYFEKIFMIFQRLHRSEQYRGTGAGLTIVRKIVEKHRGRIWVDSEVGQGTTFTFTIPA